MAAPDTSAHGDVASGGTIIRRKAQAARAEQQARAISLAKSLRLTLARVADEMLDLPLALIGYRSDTVQADDLAERLAQPGLRMLLDGPMRARAGAILDPALVGALIQQQTMGKVLGTGDDPDRKFTQTDAAVCAPFLDAVLGRAAPLPDKEEERQLIHGFAFGAWVEDARVLNMTLDLPSYELVELSLDIAGGLRQGQMLLCLPSLDAASPGAELPESPEAQGASSPRDSRAPDFAETVLNLNAQLRFSLARLQLPLKAVGALQKGSVLDLGDAAFDGLRVETSTGRVLGRGTLGQIDGMRVVRLQKAQGPREGQTTGVPGDLQAFDDPLPALTDALQDEPEVGVAEASALSPLPVEDAVAPDGAAPPEPAPMDLPDLPDLPDLSDLPDLPDMSDLPELDPDLPQLNTG